MARFKRPPRMTFLDHQNFWKEATGRKRRPDWLRIFVTLKHDICVFKKTVTPDVKAEVITNLIIPAGARVFVTPGKCRADRAIVFSNVTRQYKREIPSACSLRGSVTSWWSSPFTYRRGEQVLPDCFSHSIQECAGGIHFFVDLNDALDYMLV